MQIQDHLITVLNFHSIETKTQTKRETIVTILQTVEIIMHNMQII